MQKLDINNIYFNKYIIKFFTKFFHLFKFSVILNDKFYFIIINLYFLNIFLIKIDCKLTLQYNNFYYEKNDNIYYINESIDINKPKLNNFNGIWKIYPNLCSGLYFNNTNGYISGIAIELCKNHYFISFIPFNMNYTLYSEINISIIKNLNNVKENMNFLWKIETDADISIGKTVKLILYEFHSLKLIHSFNFNINKSPYYSDGYLLRIDKYTLLKSDLISSGYKLNVTLYVNDMKVVSISTITWDDIYFDIDTCINVIFRSIFTNSTIS